MRPVTTVRGLAKRAAKMFGECDTGDGREGVAPSVSLMHCPGSRHAAAYWRVTVHLVSGEDGVDVGLCSDTMDSAVRGCCERLEVHARFLRDVVLGSRDENAAAGLSRTIRLSSPCEDGQWGLSDADGVVADDHREAVERQREHWARQAEIIEAGGVAS